MRTVTLTPELVREIESLAGKDQADAQLFVEKAVREYLNQTRQAKIRAETEAFNAQHAKLRVTYLGQYVAMHEGKVIDHDPDLRALHLRVYAKVGRIPVLLKQVTDEPERVLTFRSPRLEKKGYEV